MTLHTGMRKFSSQNCNHLEINPSVTNLGVVWDEHFGFLFYWNNDYVGM